MTTTTNGAPYPPRTGVLPDVPQWNQALAEWADASIYGANGWAALTLLNGWTGVAGMSPQWKVRAGFLILRGRVTGGAGFIAQLPPHAQPSSQWDTITRDGSGNSYGALLVSDGGNISPGSNLSSPNLDSIVPLD